MSAELVRLAAALPPDAWPHAEALLGRIAHDLNNSISTLMMESFSTRVILDRLRTNTGSPADVEELDAICTNLDDCAESLQGYIQQVAELSQSSGNRR